MRAFLILAVLLTTPVWASETAVLYDSKNQTDLRIVFSDFTLNAAAEKYFPTVNCPVRFSAPNIVRENILHYVCKAEAIKFLLNNGYKRIDRNVYAK